MESDDRQEPQTELSMTMAPMLARVMKSNEAATATTGMIMTMVLMMIIIRFAWMSSQLFWKPCGSLLTTAGRTKHFVPRAVPSRSPK